MLLIVIMMALGVEGGGGEMVRELNSLEPQLHLFPLLLSVSFPPLHHIPTLIYLPPFGFGNTLPHPLPLP